MAFFRGEDEAGGKEAFRKWFSYIGELRSIYPKASVLALSTCTKKISKRVAKVLQFSSDCLEIRISPNRPNIKLVVKKIPNTVEMAFPWIVESLLEKTFPKTILYCTSIKDVSKIYTYIINETLEEDKVVMFHSETSQEKKDEILSSLKEINSNLKLIIATSALGMGVDMVDIYTVILYGAPSTIVELVQEIGRVGRDGRDAIALLLHNSYQLRNVDREVVEMYRLSECRRISMLAPFLSSKELTEAKKETGTHICCDVCAISCSCSTCSLTTVEKLFQCLDSEDRSQEDSDDTESYDVFEYEDTVETALLLDFDLD